MVNLQNQLSDDAVSAAVKNSKRNSANSEERWRIIDREILRLHNTNKYLDTQISHILNNRTPEEIEFLTTPVSQYTDEQNRLWAYNPDLLALSKKYDSLLEQMHQWNTDMVNLDDAKQMMLSAIDKQTSAVNKSADSSKAWTALEKAIQVWEAQWTAWNQWATAGQLNKLQSEIGNKFATKFADIEAQRQSWLGTAAQIEAGIPAQLSAIGWQNVTNRYNQSLIQPSWKGTQRSSVLNVWQGWKKYKTVIDQKTGYPTQVLDTWITAPPAIWADVNENTIPDYLEPQYQNSPVYF